MPKNPAIEQIGDTVSQDLADALHTAQQIIEHPKRLKRNGRTHEAFVSQAMHSLSTELLEHIMQNIKSSRSSN